MFRVIINFMFQPTLIYGIYVIWFIIFCVNILFLIMPLLAVGLVAEKESGRWRDSAAKMNSPAYFWIVRMVRIENRSRVWLRMASNTLLPIREVFGGWWSCVLFNTFCPFSPWELLVSSPLTTKVSLMKNSTKNCEENPTKNTTEFSGNERERKAWLHWTCLSINTYGGWEKGWSGERGRECKMKG